MMFEAIHSKSEKKDDAAVTTVPIPPTNDEERKTLGKNYFANLLIVFIKFIK